MQSTYIRKKIDVLILVTFKTIIAFFLLDDKIERS